MSRISDKRRAALGDVVTVAAFALLALVPWQAFYSDAVSLTQMLEPPSLAHPLGTDNLGRDWLVRLAAALRTAVLPLWGGVLAGSFSGWALGITGIALRERRWGRSLVSATRLLATIVASVPVGIVCFAWVAIEQKAGLRPVVLSLSILFATRSFLQLVELYEESEKLGYWEAHRAMGGRLIDRLWRYGIGGRWRPAMGRALSFHLAAAVAIEASLSYLGFGIQEPSPSFGNMLAAHFADYLKGRWASLAVIACALALTARFPASLARLGMACAPRQSSMTWINRLPSKILMRSTSLFVK